MPLFRSEAAARSVCGTIFAPAILAHFDSSEGSPIVLDALLVTERANSSSNSMNPNEEKFMPKHQLGKGGPIVSAIGLGCMAMSFPYEPPDKTDSPLILP